MRELKPISTSQARAALTHIVTTYDYAEESEEYIAEAHRQQREDFEGYRRRMQHERDAARRVMFTAFGLWAMCPHKACRRAEACRAVDTEECRRERWRHVATEETRFLLTRVMELLREGRAKHEVVDLACAEWAKREKAFAEMEGRAARGASAASTSGT